MNAPECCVSCLEGRARIRIIATDLDGTVLDTSTICGACATSTGRVKSALDTLDLTIGPVPA